MPLTNGTRLGVYEVTASIGAGGMGEVYKARDTKLNRDVALKVISEPFVTDADRLARFRREAQVLAALNHPNIAAIFGFEDPSTGSGQATPPALVLELVEGPTLADRIAEGPIPHAEALKIARQIAAGLEAAHEVGIVHRDLKPANVKVRDDGAVKILDFGLAKALDAEASGTTAGASTSPTLTARATQLGMILGTAAYMAPEQARGRAVDRRADIWAFGVVLFEMLAGRRAFEGDDVSDVLASVLKTEPDWNALPADLPAPVRRLLQRCLEKDPKKRLRDIGEGMMQLEDSLSGVAASAISMPSGPIVVEPPKRSLAARAVPLIAAAIAGAMVPLLLRNQTRDQPAAPAPIKFTYVSPADDEFYFSSLGRDLAISPDGRTIVHSSLPTASSGLNLPHLRVRRLDQAESTVLPGTEDAFGPFLSHDGQWVGFATASRQSRLMKVPIAGGPPIVISTEKEAVAGAAWLEDGSIVIGFRAGGLRRVRPGASESEELTKIDPATGETAHRWPSPIPGTSLVLFGTDIRVGEYRASLAVVDVTTGTVTRTNVGGTSPAYALGRVLWAAGADPVVRSQPFDVNTLQFTGTMSVVAENVGIKQTGSSNFAISPNGTLIYTQSGSSLAERSLVWVDRKGAETPISAPLRNYFYARVSPAGDRFSLDVRDAQNDVWVLDNRGSLQRVTSDPEQDQYGLWTPSGRHVVFQSARNQKQGIYIARADAVEPPTLLAEKPGFPNAVTPDGKTVIFRGPGQAQDLFTVPVAGGEVATLLSTPNDEQNAAISPDGRWIAYESNLSGRSDVWVRPYPNVMAAQFLISTDGGSKPVWAPRGLEIFYLSADGKITSVTMTVSRTGELTPASPVPLFDAGPYYFGGVGRNFDPHPDGTRLVMVKNPKSSTASVPVQVTLNWRGGD